MRYTIKLLVVAVLLIFVVPLVLVHAAYALDNSVHQVESFLRSIIDTMSALAGLTATAFFVIGGMQYITSTGNPERMERAKRTLIHAAMGLTIVFASFVLANLLTHLATNAFGS